MSTNINNIFTFKANFKGDLRKLRIKEIKFSWMKSTVMKTFDLDENFKLTYVDEEGDNITIGNQNDLSIAMESVPQGKMLRIFVKILAKKTEESVKEDGEKILPLMKLQKPAEKKEELLPLMKLQKPKPQPKKEEEKKEEVLMPLIKLEKPKPQPKKEEEKKDEVLIPLMKLEKPKPQPKKVEEKKEEEKKEEEKKDEVLMPLMKLEKPKPQPKEKVAPKETPKPKPTPKATPKPKEKPTTVKKEKIPIVFTEQTPSSVEHPVESFLYMSALKDLETLGFPDSYKVRSLLVNHKGDVEKTVDDLLK